MTIHRLRLEYSESGGQSFNNWLSIWLTNMEPWSERENTTPTLQDGALVSEPHYRGELTFDWSEDKAIIMDQLWGYLTSYCKWARLRYHVCDHDKSEPTPCEWEVEQTHGTLPEGV